MSARIPALDALRGIAILAVLVRHGIAIRPVGAAGIGASYGVQMGNAGVDLFFVLSGFLITQILLNERERPHYFRAFYERRIRRIFPLYYGALAVLIFAVPHIPAIGRPVSGDIGSAQLWFWTYFSNSYIATHGEAAVPSANHFWSLAIEEQFYLVWPVVVRFVAPRRIVPLCGAIMVGALALRCWMVATGRSDPYHVTLARVDALAAGALVAALRRDPGRFSRVVRYAPHAAILAAPLALSHPLDVLGPTVGYTGVAVLSACVIARAAADPNGSAAWALSRSSVLRRFGLYSYGLYVVHVPIILLLAAGGVRPATLGATLGAYWLGAVAFFALAVAMSLAVAVPSWHYFESRFLRRGAASRELVRPLCPPARIAD